MTCAKAREEKTKLLYTLNAFRSIQKRIALELRELATRDRVSFDVNYVQPKEKATNRVSQDNENDIVQTSQVDKGVNVEVDDLVMDELIDLNRYRFNGRTQT